MSKTIIESAILKPINAILSMKNCSQYWAKKKAHDKSTEDFWKAFILFLDKMIHHRKGKAAIFKQ